ncbi:hypothetical protein ACFY64_31705 [Streptomyces collinus]|uniref:hypothetical protein n=1 Tax=Streptomyces collinus TaxID=42684 RepID=UPI0036CF16C1
MYELETILPDWPRLLSEHDCVPDDAPVPREGALAPLATAGLGPVPAARYGRGWLWRCGVHVMPDGEQPAHDCTANGRSTIQDGARDAALAHVLAGHPDAAVPYVARRWHALRNWN